MFNDHLRQISKILNLEANGFIELEKSREISEEAAAGVQEMKNNATDEQSKLVNVAPREQ